MSLSDPREDELEPERHERRVSRAAQIAEFLAGMSGMEPQLFERERRAAGATLCADGAPAGLLGATRHALARGAEINHRHLQVLAEEPASACREGCYDCCHLKVSVTAPEVFALVAFIEQELAPVVAERIAARAAELARDPRIFSEYAKAEAKIPCALLTEQGACVAFDARPLACRGWNSTDADACRRALDDDSEPIPMNERWARECAAVALGFRAALAGAGLSDDLLELTSALDIALRTPDALRRWLAGEPVFAAAGAGV